MPVTLCAPLMLNCCVLALSTQRDVLRRAVRENDVQRLRPRLGGLRGRIAGDEQHHADVLGMSERHRKLWVSVRAQ